MRTSDQMIYLTSADDDWVYVRFLKDEQTRIIVKMTHEQASALGSDLLKRSQHPTKQKG